MKKSLKQRVKDWLADFEPKNPILVLLIAGIVGLFWWTFDREDDEEKKS